MQKRYLRFPDVFEDLKSANMRFETMASGKLQPLQLHFNDPTKKSESYLDQIGESFEIKGQSNRN